jgi:hypothetical protein
MVGNKSVILSVWNRKVWALCRSIKQLLDSTGPFRAVMVLMFASLAKQEAANVRQVIDVTAEPVVWPISVQ